MNTIDCKSQLQEMPDVHNVLLNREIYGHYNWSRDRYPRYWGDDTIKLGGLESFVDRLQRSVALKCHTGCVNTVRWNSYGDKIVSGSDDTYLGIWKINFQFGGESKLLNRFQSGHDSNIFHALFIPNTNDNEIISAALDCDVRYNILSKNVSKRIGTHDGACHKLDIINPNVFLSCSEDSTIKLIDMRDKSTINETRQTTNCNNTIVNLFKFSHSTKLYQNTKKEKKNTTTTTSDDASSLNKDNVIISSLPKITKEKVSVYTMTLNPLDNNILAVGCRDKWVRLFDRRTLSMGSGRKAKPYCLLTQHSLLHKQEGSRYVDSEGITGLAWSYDGQELVASYSAKNIALFNLYADRSCRDFTDCKDIVKGHEESEQHTRDLLSRFPNAQDTSDEEESTQDDGGNDNNDNEDEDEDDDDDVGNDEDEEEQAMEEKEDEEVENNEEEVNGDTVEDDINMEDKTEQSKDEEENDDDHKIELLETNNNDNNDNDEDDNNEDDNDGDIEVNDKNNDGNVVMDDDVAQFLADDDDDNKNENEENKDKQDIKEEIEKEQREIIDEIVASSPTNPANNRVKKAVSKVKGLMTGIKEKANTKSDKFKAKIKKKLPHNLFSKKSSRLNYQSYESGYIPYSLQLSNFKGHRTVETVKECNFFGPKSEYVISGSDCSHVFIWRKCDGKIVNVLKGDGRITNVVQGNPNNCSLVTSGLDKTVKLFTPTAETTNNKTKTEIEKRNKKWEDVIQQNERDSERASRPIPMSLLVYLLRRGLYGFDDSDDDDDDEDNDDQKDNNDNNNNDDDDEDENNDADLLSSFLEQ